MQLSRDISNELDKLSVWFSVLKQANIECFKD